MQKRLNPPADQGQVSPSVRPQRSNRAWKSVPLSVGDLHLRHSFSLEERRTGREKKKQFPMYFDQLLEN